MQFTGELGMTMQRLTRWITIASCLAMTCWPGAVHARHVADTILKVDLKDGSTQSSVDLFDGKGPRILTSASTIQDGIFTRLDLKLVLNDETKDEIRKMVDQGFTDEPSGCRPDEYGPLSMEDGLRYFFNVNVLTKTKTQFWENVSVTIYPGNRSAHWANDVSCEYDADLGVEQAILRFTGHYYVIHRKLKTGTDIQLRPVVLTPAEFDKLPQVAPDAK